MKFIAIVCPAFLARVNPVSAIANPACMNMTRKPHTRVHTVLMAIRLCPTVSATFAASGSFSDIALMSLSVGAPADPPMMSAIPPVAAPVGSGLGASAAIAGRTVPAARNSAARHSIRIVHFRRCVFIAFSFFLSDGSPFDGSREVDVQLDRGGVLPRAGLVVVDVVAEDHAHVLGEGPGDAEACGAEGVLPALVIHADPKLVRNLAQGPVPRGQQAAVVPLHPVGVVDRGHGGFPVQAVVTDGEPSHDGKGLGDQAVPDVRVRAGLGVDAVGDFALLRPDVVHADRDRRDVRVVLRHSDLEVAVGRVLVEAAGGVEPSVDEVEADFRLELLEREHADGQAEVDEGGSVLAARVRLRLGAHEGVEPEVSRLVRLDIRRRYPDLRGRRGRCDGRREAAHRERREDDPYPMDAPAALLHDVPLGRWNVASSRGRASAVPSGGNPSQTLLQHIERKGDTRMRRCGGRGKDRSVGATKMSYILHRWREPAARVRVAFSPSLTTKAVNTTQSSTVAQTRIASRDRGKPPAAAISPHTSAVTNNAPAPLARISARLSVRRLIHAVTTSETTSTPVAPERRRCAVRSPSSPPAARGEPPHRGRPRQFPGAGAPTERPVNSTTYNAMPEPRASREYESRKARWTVPSGFRRKKRAASAAVTIKVSTIRALARSTAAITGETEPSTTSAPIVETTASRNRARSGGTRSQGRDRNQRSPAAARARANRPTTTAPTRCRYSTKAPGSPGGAIPPNVVGQSGMALAAPMKHTAPPSAISTQQPAAAVEASKM